MRKGIIIALILVMLILLSSIDYKVNASSYTTNVVYSQTGYVNSSDTSWTSDDVFYKRNISPNANIQRYKLNIDNLNSNAQYVEFNYLISQPQTSVLSYTSTEDYCIEWKWKTITTNEGVTEWYCSKYDSNTINDHVARTPQVSGLNVYFYVDYANGAGWANCETIENNFIMCPTNGLPINGITALVNYTNAGTSTFQLAINRIIAYYNQDNSVSSAINNQTQQQQQQHNEIMNANQTYEDELDENINGTSEMNEYTQQEDALFDDLDMNTTALDGITINPNASLFIWDIVNSLRNINPAIITLMTSMLGIGIMKLVLNR